MIAPGGRASSAPLMGRATEPTLFELSEPGRVSASFRTNDLPEWSLSELVPERFRATEQVQLPDVAERDLGRDVLADHVVDARALERPALQ